MGDVGNHIRVRTVREEDEGSRMTKEGVARRVGLKSIPTPNVLALYFGLETGRSIRKNDLRDELIVRGVSPTILAEAIREILFVVGNAADNRIPEVDDQ